LNWDFNRVVFKEGSLWARKNYLCRPRHLWAFDLAKQSINLITSRLESPVFQQAYFLGKKNKKFAYAKEKGTWICMAG
jgi:hypothetical protein